MVIDFSIDKKYKGYGLGENLIKKAVGYLVSEKEVDNLIAESKREKSSIFENF